MCETHHGEDCDCRCEGGMTHAHRSGRGHSDCWCCGPSYGHAESRHEIEERGAGFRRRFRNRSEQIEELTEYLKELEAETQGVREQLADLSAQGSAD